MFVIKTTDPLKRTITLKTSTWQHKILNIYGTNSNDEHGHSHPEMKIEVVEETLSTPHYIYEDTKIIEKNGKEIEVISDNREMFIKLVRSDGRLEAIKAIVEFTEDSIGDVVTVHKFNKVSKIKTTGGVIYDSTKE